MDLGTISTDELAREMVRRQRETDRLRRRRDKLQQQLIELNQELASLGALTGGAGRTRARNSQSLADALVGVLKNRVMSVTDAADAVIKSGYTSTSANFRTIVNQTLIKDDRFQNVERGKYKAT